MKKISSLNKPTISKTTESSKAREVPPSGAPKNKDLSALTNGGCTCLILIFWAMPYGGILRQLGGVAETRFMVNMKRNREKFPVETFQSK